MKNQALCGSCRKGLMEHNESLSTKRVYIFTCNTPHCNNVIEMNREDEETKKENPNSIPPDLEADTPR